MIMMMRIVMMVENCKISRSLTAQQLQKVEIEILTQARVRNIYTRCWLIYNNLMLIQAITYPSVVRMTIAPV
jgi:hypothetical protein